MPDRLKCSECVRLGRPCVNLSWSLIKKTIESYEKKVEEDESQLATLIARLIRDKKILAQAKARLKQKTLCLMDEMEVNNELEDPDPSESSCPAASALVRLSPSLWETLAAIEQYSVPESAPG